jgi:hypothetical protein
LIAAVGDRASTRFHEFFAANIRNQNTRRAYSRAAREFLAWCEINGLVSIVDVAPLHVSTWIEAQTLAVPGPGVRFDLTLAALLVRRVGGD